jgi:hypothetical protein
MQVLAYWKAVTTDRAGFFDSIVDLLSKSGLRYCVIGGQAVNAYTEPVVSLDLDIAVATADLEAAESLLRERHQVTRFPHSVNVTQAGSDLRVQLHTDPRYAPFVERSAPRDVLGLRLPVAAVEDVLQGNVWAAQDPGCRPSKRQRASVRRAWPTSCGSWSRSRTCAAACRGTSWRA